MATTRREHNLAKAKQTIRRNDKAGGGALPEINIHSAQHTPSWTRIWNKGWANLRVFMHARAGWLDITLAESYLSERGKSVSKETMLTLEPQAARALYEFLKFHFENKAANDALDNEPINLEDEFETFPG